MEKLRSFVPIHLPITAATTATCLIPPRMDRSCVPHSAELPFGIATMSIFHGFLRISAIDHLAESLGIAHIIE